MSKNNFGGGGPVVTENWAFHATIKLKGAKRTPHLIVCGGTSVAKRWVLTSASCLVELAKLRGINQLADLKRVVIVGFVKGPNSKFVDELAYTMENIVINDNFKRADRAVNDVALIRLNADWDGGSIQLAAPNDQSNTDILAYTVGHPKGNSYYVNSNFLFEFILPTIPLERCAKLFRTKGVRIGPGNICAGYMKRSGSCLGDLGAALVSYDDKACPTQVGLLSWRENCTSDNPNVYTRVADHMLWISSHVSDLKVARREERPGGAIAERDIRLLWGRLGEALSGKVKGLAISLGERSSRVPLGALMVVEARSEVSGRLILLDVNADGEIILLLPNAYARASNIEAGQTIRVPEPQDPVYRGFAGFKATEPLGVGRIYAIVVPGSVDLEAALSSQEGPRKGLEADPTPTAFAANLFSELIAAAEKSAAGSPGWALTEFPYEIVRR